MRILEINKFFYPRRGAERHMLDVAHMLEKRGHEVRIFSMVHEENLPHVFSKYFVSYVGYNKDDSTFWQRVIGVGRLFWSFEARNKIEKLLTEWRPDVAHLHNIYHQFSPSILGPLRKRGIPVVLTVHDYNLISPDKDAYYPKVGKTYWKFLFMDKYGFMKRLLLVLKMYWNDFFQFYEKGVDYFIVPSEYVSAVLCDAGMPKKKIITWPHFIPDPDTLAQGEPVLLSRVPKENFALYFGSLSKQKGVDRLIDIFENLQIPLVLVGNEEDGFIVPESALVYRIGKQSKREISEWIQRASLVVSASSLPETFGLIALESIAEGRAFFGLKKGALPEIITQGKNGYLAETLGELQIAIRKFFSGEMSFDSSRIKNDALSLFGEKAYAERLETFFSEFKKRTFKKYL